jgi:deoxyribonuclease-4
VAGPGPLIGARVTVAGGLATGGLRYAAAVGAEVIQLFVATLKALRDPA